MSLLVTREIMQAKATLHLSGTVPINISVNGVQQLLGNLSVQKSTGPDCIPACLLKESVEHGACTSPYPHISSIIATRPYTS